MQTFKTEGLLVAAMPFQDYHQILTLFTPEHGLIKLVYKHALRAKKQAGDPLKRVEAVIQSSQGDLWKCKELTVVDSYLALRKDLKTLQAGCDILKLLQNTQQPGQEAPDLYHLTLAYLDRLKVTTCPEVLKTSFDLKLQRYEGLLAPEQITDDQTLVLAYSKSWKDIESILL